MSKIVFAVLAVFMVGALFLSTGCAKRVHYTNAFGEYSLSDAHKQYAELFQMKPCQYKRFLTFEDGWWKADVRKMKEMGVNVTDLCERYFRITEIKVPFPLLIDYEVLYGKGCRSGQG